MGIKVIHGHPDGKVCYALLANHPLEELGLFRSIDPFTFRPTVFAAAYMPYTGHWYALGARDRPGDRHVLQGVLRGGHRPYADR